MALRAIEARLAARNAVDALVVAANLSRVALGCAPPADDNSLPSDHHNKRDALLARAAIFGRGAARWVFARSSATGLVFRTFVFAFAVDAPLASAAVVVVLAARDVVAPALAAVLFVRTSLGACLDGKGSDFRGEGHGGLRAFFAASALVVALAAGFVVAGAQTAELAFVTTVRALSVDTF